MTDDEKEWPPPPRQPVMVAATKIPSASYLRLILIMWVLTIVGYYCKFISDPILTGMGPSGPVLDTSLPTRLAGISALVCGLISLILAVYLMTRRSKAGTINGILRIVVMFLGLLVRPR